MAAFFRIVQAHWVASAMTGEGARITGGRWNPPGMSAVYLAESRALAALEILVHAPREAIPLDWRVIEVEDHLSHRAPPAYAAQERYGLVWKRDDALVFA